MDVIARPKASAVSPLHETRRMKDAFFGSTGSEPVPPTRPATDDVRRSGDRRLAKRG
jgi:hypothetical protein